MPRTTPPPTGAAPRPQSPPARAPAAPARALRPYQQAGVDRFATDDGAFFAMAMRLGKTLTCIRWLRQHPLEPSKVLIVAPKTVLLAWEKELEAEGIPFHMLVHLPLKRRGELIEHGGPGFYLLNYEAVNRLRVPLNLAKPRIGAIVLDESTKIKNPSTKTTRTLLALAHTIPVRACLSGLPNPESWGDIWCQMAFVNGGSWMNYKNFWSWRNEHTFNAGHEWIYTPKHQTAIRTEFQSDAYVLTRKQAGLRDVKIYEKVIGELSPTARTVYDNAFKEWRIPGVDVDTKFPMVVVTWLRQFCGGGFPKLVTAALGEIGTWKDDELEELLMGNLKDEQVVVWFAFNSEIARVWRKLAHRIDGGMTWITGAVDNDERRVRMKRFQAGQRRVMLIQQSCGQYGIDLSAADTAIYYSCSHSFEQRAQSEERIYMPTKPNDLLIIDMITKDSVEEAVQESLTAKNEDARFLLAKIMVGRGPRNAQGT